MTTEWVPADEEGTHWQLIARGYPAFHGSVAKQTGHVNGMRCANWEYVPFPTWKDAVKYVEEATK